MAIPELSKLFALGEKEIDAHITKTSPGVYALDKHQEGAFTVYYVGRSDTDVNKRLKDWVGKYKYAKFAYASSAKAAFEGECELYHAHKPTDNVLHPDRPRGSDWKCPRCKNFG